MDSVAEEYRLRVAILTMIERLQPGELADDSPMAAAMAEKERRRVAVNARKRRLRRRAREDRR